jgi:ATP-binding cassette, subfamily C, bacterial LapB
MSVNPLARETAENVHGLGPGLSATVAELASGNPVHNPAAKDQGNDAILAIVQYLAQLWHRPANPDLVTAGLPLVEGRIPLSLIDVALDRIGASCEQVRKPLRRLSEFDLPALALTPDGHPIILVSRASQNRLSIFDPRDGEERLLDLETPRYKRPDDLILVRPEIAKATGAASSQKATRNWLREVLTGHEKSLLHIVLAAAFINIFAIAFPLFTLNVYDRVLPNAATATLWVLAVGLGIVLLFDFLLKVARGAIIDYIGRRIDFRLASRLFSRVVNSPLAERPGTTGTFINRIGQYEVLREFMTSSTLAMFVDVVFMFVFAAVIYILIGWLVVFPVLAGFIAITVTLLIGRLSGRAVQDALAESSARNSILVEALSSPQTVKASRAEGELQRRWETTVLASSQTQNTIKWFQSVATNITALASQLAMVSIIIGGTYLFADGEISMGAIIASMMLSNRLIAPIGQISAALLRTRSAVQAFQTVSSIMTLPDERVAASGFVGRALTSGSAEFRNVRFAYPGAKTFVLDGINLKVAPGEKVGIIGKIGSGKTTLGRLLVNFYQPNEGELLLDGVSLSQFHPATLRKDIGLLIQDPELFDGTVRDNILLADPTAGEQRLLAVAKRAGVDEFVARHPMGFDMPVGERGILLSGGQRQAIALARTMISEPKILFLDEPTSSMDLASERQLISHLSTSLGPEHTVLIATHRYSLLSLVTRLIVIDNGRIRADGPRDQVMAQLQAGGKNVATH